LEKLRTYFHDNRARKEEIPMIVLFLLPLLAVYTYFFISPSVQAFYVSLNDWNGFTANMSYVGFKNFEELMGDPAFMESIRISLIFMFGGGAIIFGISFFLSAMLATHIRFKKTMRAIIFFPSVISCVAVALLWNFIYNTKWGLLNNFLKLVGLDQLIRTWSSTENLTGAMLAVLAWTYCGYFCVILLSALDRVPESYIEAAKVDGANEVTIFFKIKLPMIKNIIGTAITLWVIDSIKEFGVLYAWNGSGTPPDVAITNMAVKMYITAFGRRVTVFRMGYATAMGVVMFLFVLVLVPIVFALFNRDKYEY